MKGTKPADWAFYAGSYNHRGYLVTRHLATGELYFLGFTDEQIRYARPRIAGDRLLLNFDSVEVMFELWERKFGPDYDPVEEFRTLAEVDAVPN